ncbi:MAG: hypothetical protein JETT_0799 [Candidatus Jettenia ecosi]|uniref:Uncharacterized protein n=1 Tax=Candidatus Jettenia ecosi TaxID=2494326 RepID=A0A533QEA1_9BACT|nr:MAG: hypothetical protein JETT_0799 [Candidatus Jettenia ecosi]
MYLRYVFFISCMMSQHSALGDSYFISSQIPSLLSSVSLQENDEDKIKKPVEREGFENILQSEYQDTTTSCIDRCHVNYTGYKHVYQDEVFLHKVHSPEQGLECGYCHNNDAVGAKTHGKLIIQSKDCIKCHHEDASNEDCLQCHGEVKEYMDGNMQSIDATIPDWMSKDVFCKDCHSLESDGASFKSVRGYCVECHSSGYGVLYDAWKKMLDEEIKEYYKNETRVTMVSCDQVDSINIPLLRKTVNSVAEFLFSASSHSQETELEGGKDLQKKAISRLDIANRQNLLELIESNGMHNILLTQILLKYIKTEQQQLK